MKQILAVWVSRGPGCDLSLEEMSAFLTGAAAWTPPQVKL